MFLVKMGEEFYDYGTTPKFLMLQAFPYHFKYIRDPSMQLPKYASLSPVFEGKTKRSQAQNHNYVVLWLKIDVLQKCNQSLNISPTLILY